jgi:hypothetical protein
MKTAIQQALESYDGMVNGMKESGIFDKRLIEVLDAIRPIFSDLLPTERHQIEDAYSAGRSDGEFTDGSTCIQFSNSSDYFTQTYNS